MAIKVSNTTSFRGEVKPSVPCRKILRLFKKSLQYERDICKQHLRTFLDMFVPAALLGVYWLGLLTESSGG
jgi:hypothetical protein